MALSIVPSCLGQQEMRFFNYGRCVMKVACIIRPCILPCIKAKPNGLRVFVVSDLHTDYSENMTWVRGLSTTVGLGQNKDVLLVAGDVAETCNNFLLTMSLLKDKFAYVFFVPGNHDLWLRREKDNNINSLEKLDELLDACQRIGVETNPTVVGGLGIIPLFSWYHEACKDYNACRWPAGLKNGDTSLALYFDAMNDKNQETFREMQGRCHQIISFSHFVPRQCCLTLLLECASKSCAQKRECFSIRISLKLLDRSFLRLE